MISYILLRVNVLACPEILLESPIMLKRRTYIAGKQKSHR